MRSGTATLAVLVMFMLVSLAATAKEDQAGDKEKAPLSVQRATGKAPEELGRRKRINPEEAIARRRRDREEMARGVLHTEQLRKLDEQIEEKRGFHNNFVGELKAIKELAVQEKAEKTAKRLQELIDKSTGQFDKDVEKLEQKRARIREQIEKHSQERLKRRERLMERRKQEQKQAAEQGKQGEGKAKGRERTKTKSKGDTEP